MAKANKKVAQPKTVKLVTTGDNAKTIEFDIAHALRLLRMPKCQWKINDSKFIFDGNEIKRKPSKTTDSGAEE